MLNKSGESGHPCLVPARRENAFSFSLFSMMLAVGLLYMAFIMLRLCSLCAHFLESFYHTPEVPASIRDEALFDCTKPS